MTLLGIAYWAFLASCWIWTAYIVLGTINHWGRLARWEVVTHPYEENRISIVRGSYRWRWQAEKVQKRMNRGNPGSWFVVPVQEVFDHQK